MGNVAKSPRRTAARKLQESYKDIIEAATARIKKSEESEFDGIVDAANAAWIDVVKRTMKSWKNVNPDESLARTDLGRVVSREVYHRARVGEITEDKLIKIGFKRIDGLVMKQYEYQATSDTPKITIIKSSGGWVMLAGIPGEILPKSGRVQDRKKGAFISNGNAMAWNIDERKLDMTVISGMTIIMSKLDGGWSPDMERLVANASLLTLNLEVKKRNVAILSSIIVAEAIAIAAIIMMQ